MVMATGARGPQTFHLKITRGTVFEGKKVKVGDVVIASSRYLVHIGKAVDYIEEDEPAKRNKLSLNK
jgi:hydrogenase maturation factor